MSFHGEKTGSSTKKHFYYNITEKNAKSMQMFAVALFVDIGVWEYSIFGYIIVK
jgi:hypothetical protein